MGLLGKVGKGIGKAAMKAGKASSAAIKKRKLQKSVEMRILERYKTEHFQKLLKRYGIDPPPRPERGYLKKEDYVNYVYDHFKLSTVIAFSEENHIHISDIMEDYKKAMELIEKEAKVEESGQQKHIEERERAKPVQYPVPKDRAEQLEHREGGFERPSGKKSERNEEAESSSEEFRYILRLIKDKFEDIYPSEIFRDEAEFQKTIFTILKGEPSFRDTKKEEPLNKRKVDLLVNGKYALELKYADRKSTLQFGVDEIMDYVVATPYVGVIILDVGQLSGETIDRYKNKYEKLGASVVILKGRSGRKKKRRGTQITIKP